jgi:hypothetical protein
MHKLAILHNARKRISDAGNGLFAAGQGSAANNAMPLAG